MKNNLVVLKDFPVKIRIEKVLANLKTNNLDKNINILLLKEIQEFYATMQPFCLYKILEKADDCSNDLFYSSKDVSNLLLKSEKIVIFACSLGIIIDGKIEEFLKTKQILKASMWDAIGSEAVEQCANYVNDLLKKKVLLDDYLVTKRYSAGYGDWSLENNKKISKILEFEKFDIKINEYGLLNPQKTITAILGLERRKEKYDFNK